MSATMIVSGRLLNENIGNTVYKETLIMNVPD